jgi:hypothetical protein
MVALEEQEVLQQQNQNPLCLHGVELDARLKRQHASHRNDVGESVIFKTGAMGSGQCLTA